MEKESKKDKKRTTSKAKKDKKKGESHDVLTLMHKHLPPIKTTFTNEEKEALKLFRKKIENHERKKDLEYFTSDDYYSRWLMARKWDVEKAAEMFIKSMEWRKTEKVDEIHTTFPSNPHFKTIKEYWPFNGDKSKTFDGGIVVYEQIGKGDPRVVDMFPPHTLLHWHIYEMECIERKRAEIHKQQGHTTGVVYIQDLAGLGWSHFYKPGISLVGQCESVDQDNYPESLRKLYLLNAPSIFNLLWKIVKGWFDEATISKFKFMSSGYEEEFREIIPLDQLLKKYGGNLNFDLPPGGPIKGLKKDKKSYYKMDKKDQTLREGHSSDTSSNEV